MKKIKIRALSMLIIFSMIMSISLETMSFGNEPIKIPEREDNNVVLSGEEDLETVTVKHIDIQTDKPIAEEVLLKGAVGDTYESVPLELEGSLKGYELVETPSNTKGAFVENDATEIIYKYRIKTVTLTVRYLEKGSNGNIIKPMILRGNVGESYTTTDVGVLGYELVETPTNATGKYPYELNIEVIYLYSKKAIVVSSFEELKEAIQEINSSDDYGKINKIIIENDIEMKETLRIEKDMTIEGYNYEDNSEIVNETDVIPRLIGGIHSGPMFVIQSDNMESTVFELKGLQVDNANNSIIQSADNATLYIDKSIIKDNSATNGALVNLTTTKDEIDGFINIANSIVKNNSTTGDGGVIYTSGYMSIDYDLDRLKFENNQSDGNGGVIHTDLNFENSDSDNLQGFADYNIEEGTEFINNSSAKNGGAISHLGKNSEFIVNISDDFIFTGNRALNGKGGAIYAEGGSKEPIFTTSNINLGNGRLIKNVAKSGGAIYLNEYFGELEILDVEFKENKVVNDSGYAYGGAIAANGSIYADILDSQFIDNRAEGSTKDVNKNTASGFGGAIDLDVKPIEVDDIAVNIINSTFKNNYATRNGGAISVYKQMDNEIVNDNEIDGFKGLYIGIDSKFEKNTADNGKYILDKEKYPKLTVVHDENVDVDTVVFNSDYVYDNYDISFVDKKKPTDPTDPGEPGGTIKEITLVGGRATLTERIEEQLSSFTLHRLYGRDRYGTSADVSKEYGKRDTVVLASGEKYTDELTATVLANKMDVPILLSYKDVVPEVVMKEIERLGAKKVIIVGETGTLSKKIEKQLSKYNLERIGGETRYETAILLGEKIRSITKKLDEAILVDGTNFPDAIAMTSMGVEQSMPILLTPPENFRDSTAKAIKDWKLKKVTIGGGTASVSSSIENKLKETIEVDRIKGTDRYHTSVLVAKQVYINPIHAVVASGEVFPDAIVGAPYAAKKRYPIVLSRGNDVPAVVMDYVNGR